MTPGTTPPSATCPTACFITARPSATGAYNLLLKLEGIDCYALPNATHIWTVATLDGETVHIDATWGDQGNTGTKQYFAMTPEQSYSLHPWPKENELPQ